MNKKKKNLLIWGYYGAGNYGDELMLSTIINKISSIKNFNIFYSVKEIKNNSIYEGIQIPFFNRRCSNKLINMLLNITFLLKTASKMDVIIIGGGTQYFELSKKDWLSIYLQYLVFLIVRTRGKKIMNLSVGIGSIKTKLGKRYLRKIFNLSSFNSVRDKYSLETLLKIGVPSMKVELWSDLTYAIKHKEKKITNNFPKTIKIGINFFDFYNYIEHDSLKDTNYREEISRFIEYLNANKFDVYFFALQKKVGGRDYEFNKKLAENSSHKVHYFEKNIDEFTCLIGKMDINIGLRYHFAVLSFQSKTPVIGINYQPKIKREFEYFGLSDWTLEMDQFSSNNLIIMLEKLLREKSNYLNKFETKLEETMFSQSENIKRIDNLLNV